MADEEDNEHEFARETVMVDFGQDLPPPQMFDVYERAEDLPEVIEVALHIEQGPSAPATVTMQKPIVVLGRVDDVADVAVADDAASRYHACVSHRDGKFILNDMGSTNGTIVNGEIAGEVELKSGDTIQIGTSVIRFEVKAKG